MTRKLYPVILAGGIGSRLWPVSRAHLPKQFSTFAGQAQSLFQETVTRALNLGDLGGLLVICNEEHRFLVAEQLRTLPGTLPANTRILLEPVGRNTAPAIAAAARLLLRDEPDALMLIMPSDHLIKQNQRFTEALEHAAAGAAGGKLVTFGIVPDAPETGYGYLRQGDALDEKELFALSAFVEKPDARTAQSYLDSGDYYWNSGMFVFQAQNYLDELRRQQPEMDSACALAAEGIEESGDFLWLPREEFAACPSDSIDYAVMEKTAEAAMVLLDAGWNDLGSWDSVWKVMKKDSQHNVIAGDAVTVDTAGSYVQAGSRLVATVGLSNTIVIDTADAVLVADMNHAQLVKDVVKKLDIRPEAQLHRKVSRPWGSYESVAIGVGYQVKHIIVNPGQALSLQLHHQRSEHWTVIQGEAQVRVGEDTKAMRRNESVYIPLETVHRLSNESDGTVEIIEVQLGDYLGEDDIVRFEDKYGRVERA